jgi:hypothetical protein
MPRMLKQYTQDGFGQTVRLYNNGGEVDETGSAELEDKEYVLSQQAANSLGSKFLDFVNETFRKDPKANPLVVIGAALAKLPDVAVKPSMNGRSKPSGSKMNAESATALGKDFLGALETFLRLHQGDAKKAFFSNKLLEKLGEKKE